MYSSLVKLFCGFSFILTINCESDIESDGIEFIERLTSQIQGELDRNFNYNRDQSSVEENDRETEREDCSKYKAPCLAGSTSFLSETIYNNLREKMQILTDLRNMIESELRTVNPSTNKQGFKTCCQVPIPDWSPAHGSHVNFDTWCLDGDVLNSADREFSIISPVIRDAFKEKFDEWSEVLKYLYFGTEEGVLFNHPGYRNCFSYDPRFRPWYVEAVTPQSKDVVLILDISGSMRDDVGSTTYLNLAKEAATTVLETLNPNDRVNIVAFNDVAVTPGDVLPDAQEGCYSEQLVAVTRPNKEIMKDFINSLRADGETSYMAALSRAFQLFQNTTSSGINGDMAILMLTDGAPHEETDDEIVQVIRTENARLGNKVVIFAYGIGPEQSQAETLLEAIAKQDFYDPSAGERVPGTHTPVESPTNLRYDMATFYDFFASYTSDVLFLTPYLDAYGTGMQVPMCIRIQKDFELFGVLCVDQSLTDYFDGVSSYSKHVSSYAFVVDSKGTVLIHPLLSNPTTVTNGLNPVLLTSLELSLDSETIVNITSGQQGVKNVTSRVVQSKGDVYWEGTRVQRKTSTYRWFPIGETGYVLVTVNPTDVQSYSAEWSGPASNSCPYHKHENQAVCDLHGRVVSFESRIFLSSEAFKQHQFYREIDTNIDSYCNFLTGGNVRNEWFKNEIRDIFYATKILDMFVSEESYTSSDILYYELVTVAGVHRIFPGMAFPDGYNPLMESWFSRCRTSNGQLTVGLPEENPLGLTVKGISFCKPLYYKSNFDDTDEHLYGVINVVVRLETAWQILTRDIPDCNERVCFIMNEAGMILLHGDWFGESRSIPSGYERTHLMQKEPHIARDLTDMGHTTPKECTEADFDQDENDGPRKHKLWQINLRSSTGAVNGDEYTINRLDGTNIFTVVSSPLPDNEPCDCFSNHLINQCHESSSSCFCPCFVSNLEEYDICSGILTLTADSAVSCSPEAIEFSFDDLARQEANRNVRNCPGIQNPSTISPVGTSGESGRNGNDKEKDAPLAWIGGVVAAVVVIIVLLVITFVFVCRHLRNREVEDKTDYSDIHMVPSNNPYPQNSRYVGPHVHSNDMYMTPRSKSDTSSGSHQTAKSDIPLNQAPTPCAVHVSAPAPSCIQQLVHTRGQQAEMNKVSGPNILPVSSVQQPATQPDMLPTTCGGAGLIQDHYLTYQANPNNTDTDLTAQSTNGIS